MNRVFRGRAAAGFQSVCLLICFAGVSVEAKVDPASLRPEVGQYWLATAGSSIRAIEILNVDEGDLNPCAGALMVKGGGSALFMLPGGSSGILTRSNLIEPLTYSRASDFLVTEEAGIVYLRRIKGELRSADGQLRAVVVHQSHQHRFDNEIIMADEVGTLAAPAKRLRVPSDQVPELVRTTPAKLRVNVDRLSLLSLRVASDRESLPILREILIALDARPHNRGQGAAHALFLGVSLH